MQLLYKLCFGYHNVPEAAGLPSASSTNSYLPKSWNKIKQTDSRNSEISASTLPLWLFEVLLFASLCLNRRYDSVGAGAEAELFVSSSLSVPLSLSHPPSPAAFGLAEQPSKCP
jgi:hypothetical protein